MNFSVADKHVHPSPYLSPPQTSLDNDLVSEHLNPVSPIVKMKNSAFKRYDFTLGLPWTSQ